MKQKMRKIFTKRKNRSHGKRNPLFPVKLPRNARLLQPRETVKIPMTQMVRLCRNCSRAESEDSYGNQTRFTVELKRTNKSKKMKIRKRIFVFLVEFSNVY